MKICGFIRICFVWLCSVLFFSNSLSAYECRVIANQGGFSCLYSQASFFGMPMDLPFFSSNTGPDAFRFDLNENTFQNSHIRSIYKNDKTKTGPFDYCTDSYGCRFIKKGGDQALDRIERDNANGEVSHFKSFYTTGKRDIAYAAENSKSIKSRSDVKGELPEKIYDKQIEIILTDIRKDLPTIRRKNEETVAAHTKLQNIVIPGQSKLRAIRHAENEASVATAQAELVVESQKVGEHIADIEEKLSGTAEVENQLKRDVFEAINQSSSDLKGQSLHSSPYSGDSNAVKEQVVAASNVYRMNGYTLQANRMAELANQLDNFNKGNSLPYQSTVLSPEAVAEYGPETAAALRPKSFARFATIVLLNTIASDLRSHPEIDEEIRDYFRLMARTVSETSRSIGDEMQTLETGWAVRDFATHLVGGIVKMGGDIGALILTPIDDTMDIFVMAIIDYDKTWTALIENIPRFYDRVINCGNASGSDDCASIIGEHSLDIAGILSAAGAGLRVTDKLVKAGNEAATVQFTSLKKLSVAAETIGITSGEALEEFVETANKIGGCDIGGCRASAEFGNVERIVDSAKNSTLDVSVINNIAGSSADAIRLRTQLRFMEDGILDTAGKITQQAATDSKMLIRGSDLNNPAVIVELTKDGSKISDWGKYTTKAVTTSNGQKLQVHYYRNDVTGAINYNIDFKINQVVQP